MFKSKPKQIIRSRVIRDASLHFGHVLETEKTAVEVMVVVGYDTETDIMEREVDISANS